MNSKSIYTPELGKEVAKQARTISQGKYHVISSETKWKIVPDGKLRSIRNFTTQDAAVNYAKKLIANKPVGLVVVHDKNGGVVARY